MNSNYFKKYEPVFGAWTITDKIGHGTYGQVFVIEREDMGSVYKSALKAITIPQSESEIRSTMADGMTMDEVTAYYKELVYSIVQEFELMSKLKGNSHIVSYEDHAIFEHDDDIGWDILIRMELLTPLVDITSERTLKEEEVIRLGIDMCKALEFCRKFNIVHRDIKPENIFIAPSGDYKIGDFGVARLIEKTQAGMSRKGTFTYMAPEEYRGEAYGPTVDIYSLGIVMYKLLNDNRTPFLPKTPNVISYNDREDALSKRLRGEELQPMSTGSKRLQDIVFKACSYDSRDRYRSASDMREDLEALLHGDKGKPIRRRKRRSRFFVAAAMALLLLCGAFIAAPKDVTGIEGIAGEKDILIGETYAPEYKIKPWYFRNKELGFSNYDNVISVSDDGAVTAESVGTTSLDVSAGGFTRQIEVNVIPKVTGITGIDDEIDLVTGDEAILKPALHPEKYADEKVTYKSSDTDVATVSAGGRIKAEAAGETEITIMAGGYEKTVEVSVTDPAAYAPGTSVNNNSSRSYGSGGNNSTTSRSSYAGKNSSGSGGSGSSGGGSSSGGSSPSGGSSSGGNSPSGGSNSSGGSGDYFDSADDEFF